MEPAKKYLLLEHKAKKGRSLLSSKNPEDESSTDSLNDFDDDILPKELEFQLFVPTELNARTNSRLHPDTSYENIQAHHWIKICLRISKQDPEESERGNITKSALIPVTCIESFVFTQQHIITSLR